MCDSFDPVLNCAGDVRNDLYSLAQVVTLPLFLYNVRVDFARGEVVVSTESDIQVALVVSQVKICFTTVVEDVNLAWSILARLLRLRKPHIPCSVGAIVPASRFM